MPAGRDLSSRTGGRRPKAPQEGTRGEPVCGLPSMGIRMRGDTRQTRTPSPDTARALHGAIVRAPRYEPGLLGNASRKCAEPVRPGARNLPRPLSDARHKPPNRLSVLSKSAHRADAAPPPRNRWFVDSPLEQRRLEPSVPLVQPVSEKGARALRARSAEMRAHP